MIKARTSAVALLLTMRMTTSTKAWTCTRTGSRRTKGTVEGTGNAEPLTLSAANSPTAHIISWTTNLPEGVVGGGAGVEVGAGAVGERLLLALMCRTTVATATTTGNPVITIIKRGIDQKKSTFSASFSAHDARLPLHPYKQRCKKICFTRLLR